MTCRPHGDLHSALESRLQITGPEGPFWALSSSFLSCYSISILGFSPGKALSHLDQRS